MNFSKWGVREIIVLLLGFSLIGSVSASQYFTASNTLTDEIDIAPNDDRIPLKVGYVDGEELGGENKTLQEGEWEEFGIELKNDSPENAIPWENVLIRVKFYSIQDEYIRGKYKQNGTWENSHVYDLRSVESGGVGGVIDFGPEEGWSIQSQAEENFRLRVKFETSVQDVQVEIRAIVNNDKPKTSYENVKDPKSTIILEPTKSAYIDQAYPSKNYGDKDHLEVATKENSNVYTLLEFDLSNIPSKPDSAELNLYQYWGSGFVSLRDSGVKLQIFPILEDWKENRITWENMPIQENSVISEEPLKGIDEWYSFDLTQYTLSLENKEDLNLLLKLSYDDFDNEKRRIRFRTASSREAPYLCFEE